MLPAPFVAHILGIMLQESAQGSAAAMPGVVPRTWQVPLTFPIGTDIQDPAGFITACDRTELNYDCIEEYHAGTVINGGRIGVVGALKTAMDYQACYERALHARHASPVRLRAWSSARRTGHGDSTFGVYAQMMASLNASISAARSVPNMQPNA